MEVFVELAGGGHRQGCYTVSLGLGPGHLEPGTLAIFPELPEGHRAHVYRGHLAIHRCSHQVRCAPDCRPSTLVKQPPCRLRGGDPDFGLGLAYRLNRLMPRALYLELALLGLQHMPRGREIGRSLEKIALQFVELRFQGLPRESI